MVSTSKTARRALTLALKSLLEIRADGWTIRQECGAEDCVICPRKTKARARAEKAIEALQKVVVQCPECGEYGHAASACDNGG